MMRKRIHTDQGTDFMTILDAGNLGEAPVDSEAVIQTVLFQFHEKSPLCKKNKVYPQIEQIFSAFVGFI